MSVNDTDVREGRINDQLGTQLESISAQVEAGLEHGRNVFAEWQHNFNEQAGRTCRQIDQYARENPWPLVCAAVVLGLLTGACVKRH